MYATSRRRCRKRPCCLVQHAWSSESMSRTPAQTRTRPSSTPADRFSSSSTAAGDAPSLGTIARSSGRSSPSTRAISQRMSPAALRMASSCNSRRIFSAAWSQSVWAFASSWRSFPSLCESRSRSACRLLVNRRIRSHGTTSASDSRPSERIAGCRMTSLRAAMEASTFPKFWSNLSCTRSYLCRNNVMERLHVARWLVRLSRTACAASRCTPSRASARAAIVATGLASATRRHASAILLRKASKAGSCTRGSVAGSSSSPGHLPLPAFAASGSLLSRSGATLA
mmetsp:Transcript_2771/g.7761  ORF Transcript_2771/g.7761 Transcript_2771/m.7761 type:complete len:284 (-) Transcript_2771:277-1128(-)